MHHFAETLAAIKTILYKEWLELRQERLVFWGVLIQLPVVTMFAIGTVTLIGVAAIFRDGPGPTRIDAGEGLYAESSNRSSETEFPIIGTANPAFAEMSSGEVAQSSLGLLCSSLLVLMLPWMIPSVVAAYSIVGEKTSHTLEPLLATPLTTTELLFGKILAALIPTIAITWLCTGMFALAMLFVAITPQVFAAIISPAWILLVFLYTPCMALTAIAATVAISARVNDPRNAQQVNALMVLPTMSLIFGQATGLIVLSPLMVLMAIVVLALLAALATWGVVRLFERETILTRWR